MADGLGGLRHLIDRNGLPPRVTELVKHIESGGQKIDAPHDRGWQEVRVLMELVDGANLMAAIVAHYAANVSLPEPAGVTEAKSEAPYPSIAPKPSDNPLYPDDLLPGDNPPKEPRQKLVELEKANEAQRQAAHDKMLDRSNPNENKASQD